MSPATLNRLTFVTVLAAVLGAMLQAGLPAAPPTDISPSATTRSGAAVGHPAVPLRSRARSASATR